MFEAVFETRSVSRAAERLAWRQPAVSTALSRLRLAFGDELFERAAGGMQPTPRAVRLSASVATALGELRTAISDVPFAPSVSEQTFTIASTDYTTLVILPGVVAAIGREAPGVDLRIIGYDKDDIPGLIDTGQIDVALGVFRTAPERAVRQLLCPEHFVGVARAGHPLIRDGEISLEDYLRASHALVSVRRDATGEVDTALASRGLKRRVALTLPHMLVLPSLLEKSDLIAALPSRIAAGLRSRLLQEFALPIPLPAWRIEMVWNPGARKVPASRWLRSKIIEAAGLAC